ncbi:MAG: ATP-binding protein [Oscillospiraceae bacterium]|nr:ATP-binding protein [Oscillospiraceae bacterium]
MIEDKKNVVLIVDDETANIIAMTNILSTDYDVFAAKNGADAIELANEHLPDVILLDVLMPEMDGYEVISTLKSMEKTKSIPVIFITGLDNIEAERKGLGLGAADYIPKPFNPDIVKLRVENQVKLVNHIRTLEERDELERQLKLIKELEAGLIAAKEQAEHHRELAEHSSRAKSEFLARMSHEMLTPMNAITGMLQIVKLKNIPNDIDDYIGEITKASNHLLNLINGVLDISGTEYGVFKLAHEEFNFVAMITNVIQTAQYNASQKKQGLVSFIDAKIPEKLRGDEMRLQQVIGNLLANAVKFSPDGSDIRFDARMLSNENNKVTLRFEVQDSGIGISEEQQKGLFTIFEQVDGSITRKHGGIGIGLALSKRIVELMGGTITLESDLDKGAKFTFTCVFECV